MNFWANLGIGILSGLIASVATLVGDRLWHRQSTESRLRTIAGTYRITGNSADRDTSRERITIEHAGSRRFHVTAAGGPTGDWEGYFSVSEDFFDVARGFYRYGPQADWGHHEYLFDREGRIFVYGINRSKPGYMEPFSLTLERIGSEVPKPAQEQAAGDDAAEPRAG